MTRIYLEPGPLFRRVVVDNNLRPYEPGRGRNRYEPYDPSRQEDVASAARIARLLGTTERQVKRWRAGQSLTRVAADKAATHLGYHPVDIWPDWYELTA